MKTKMRKWFTLLTAASLLVFLLAACGGKTNENSAQPSGEQASSTPSSTPSGAPVTLKVEMFDRGNAPAGAGPVTDNFWTQWMQKNFGDPNNIKLEFVPVPRNQEVEKLNILMGTGDAPDIVFTYDLNTIYNYVKQVCGRSSKSFIEEGRLEEILQMIKPGDYLFIQFGHNDSKEDSERHTSPWSTYHRYL